MRYVYDRFPRMVWYGFSLICLSLAVLLGEAPVKAQGVINEYVAVCDPSVPTHCTTVSAAGFLTNLGFGQVFTSLSPIGAGADVPYTMTGSRYLVTVPYSIPEATWQWNTAGTPITTATTVQIQAAGAAGVRNYLSWMECSNSIAVGTEIQVLDGSTVIYDSSVGGVTGFANTIGLFTGSQIPLRGSPATAMSIKVLATGAGIYCTATGFQAN